MQEFPSDKTVETKIIFSMSSFIQLTPVPGCKCCKISFLVHTKDNQVWTYFRIVSMTQWVYFLQFSDCLSKLKKTEIVAPDNPCDRQQMHRPLVVFFYTRPCNGTTSFEIHG